MCYCDVCEGSWHEQPWLATEECVLMNSELHGVMGNAGGDEGRITTADLQVTSEAASVCSELHGVNGDAGGDEGRITTADLQFTPEVRITTAEGAFCADKDAEGVFLCR